VATTKLAQLPSGDKLPERLVKAAEATVSFLSEEGKPHGQGVVVPGQMIVTAAHVVQWDKVQWGRVEGALSDPMHEQVMVAGRPVLAQVYAFEPITDVAVLGAPDGQSLPHEYEAFEAALGAVTPARLARATLPLQRWLSVYIRAHDQGWVKAEASVWTVHRDTLALRTDTQCIAGGTSGGPIVTPTGKLLGVVSVMGGTSDGTGTGDGSAPCLHQTVPPWLLRQMLDPEWEGREQRRERRRWERSPEGQRERRRLAALTPPAPAAARSDSARTSRGMFDGTSPRRRGGPRCPSPPGSAPRSTGGAAGPSAMPPLDSLLLGIDGS
jgi:hypothetical protein